MVEEKISYSVPPLTSVVTSVEPLISVVDVVEAIDSSVDVKIVVSVGPLSDVSSVTVLPVNASVVVSDAVEASVVEPVDSPDSSSPAITLGGGVTSSLGSFSIIISFDEVAVVVSVSLDSLVLAGMVLASVVLSLVDESVVVSVEDSEVDEDSSDVSVVIIVVLYSVVLSDVGCSVVVDSASVVLGLEESEKKTRM